VRWILASFVVIVAAGCPHLSADSGRDKNILVLYGSSLRETFIPLEPLKRTVRSRVPVPIDFYVEYLESQRFGNPGYRETLKESIRQAYSGKQIDLVVVSSYPALLFAVDYRDQIFPGVPIIFISVAAGRFRNGIPWTGVTGVTTNIDVRGSLDLALHLHPDTQNLAVVSGDSEVESYWRRVFGDEVRQRPDKLKLIEMTTESAKQVLEQASALPPHTILFFGRIPQESSQQDLGTYDLIGALGQRLPTYCFFFYCLDHGAVGGSYTDQRISGVKGGEIAARVLSGEKPENIPLEQNFVTHPYVDSRQLRRWNIWESALPPGTIVLYRQPTPWERSRNYILAGVAVIIVQALLIAGLFWQRHQRKSAAGALQKLGGLLIHAQEDERASIARELHDDFSQRLALQCIELTQLEHNLPETQFEGRKRALKLLGETKEMSKDMRALSHQLHSSNLELVGLVSALRGLCAEITKNYEITVHFTEPEFPPKLTKDMELGLFRVAQEALANVIKHSDAGSAHIELGSSGNGVSLRISDKGKGFDPNRKTTSAGIGLESMRERLRVLDGRLSVRSEITRGTEVLAEIPLSAFQNKKRA
jgi:signal transduction histidine kinase/ABC-type uncharacterized transport system substrate-binding protein